MKCEKHNTEMRWYGDMLTGGPVCDRCRVEQAVQGYFIDHPNFLTKALLSKSESVLCECPSCGEERQCRRYHRGTAYQNEELNWNFGCEECEHEEREEWRERWAEYHSGCL